MPRLSLVGPCVNPRSHGERVRPPPLVSNRKSGKATTLLRHELRCPFFEQGFCVEPLIAADRRLCITKHRTVWLDTHTCHPERRILFRAGEHSRSRRTPALLPHTMAASGSSASGLVRTAHNIELSISRVVPTYPATTTSTPFRTSLTASRVEGSTISK